MLCLTICIKNILELKNGSRVILSFGLIVGAYLFLNEFGTLLEYYRVRMYAENTGLPKELAPKFNYFDAFNFLIKPFILTAKNDLQIIQSCENILLFFPLLMIVYIRIINKQFWSYCYLEFMLLSSCIIYSYVVFNYGTLTRYKFPFIVCYVVMNLIQLDIKSKTTKLKIT
ncbi:hypothetical protein CUN60_00030 [Aquella oligotrophica]|uniref:Uncharacterized protein n=2 Tax=Aquella oligotrophica TaxID=2067065 RepID=A0A2I7N2S1_9NEIS|nr:hypothetical protein CUN60_00030 [Aquella oligotrophica]